MSYHFPTESTAHTSSSPPIDVQKVHASDIIETQEKPSTDITSSTSLQNDATDQQQVSSSLVAVSFVNSQHFEFKYFNVVELFLIFAVFFFL